MVLIGNKPIVWHIIKYYNSFGFKDFILATGYKHKTLEEYFKKIELKIVIFNLFLQEIKL